MGTWDWNLTTDRLSWDARQFDLFGIDRNAFNGLAAQALQRIHPEDQERVRQAIRQAVEQHTQFCEDFRIVHADGSVRWLAARAQPFADPQGRVTRMIGVNFDITAHMQVEEALRESEARLRLALDSAEMGAWDWNLNSDRVLMDERQRLLTGAASNTRTESGAEGFRRVHPEDRTALERVVARAIEQNAPFRAEFRMIHPDGQVRWVAARGQPIADKQGRVTRLIGVNFDITARKHDELLREHRHEEEMARLYRIGTVNELAGGLAHELSQPLTAIQNYAGGGLKWIDAGGDQREIRHALEAINAQSSRVVEIIQHLRRLMVTGEPQRAPTDLNEIMVRASDLLKVPLARKNVKIKLALASDVPKASVDALQIEQVVVILMRNCIDAFSGEYLAHPVIELRTATRPDGRAEVAVTDNGPGATPGALQQLFDPFYTTKEKGLGLGLMLARSIVRAHHGAIEARPGAAGGLTVCFTLPVEGRARG
jgi:PAS domain S-box-containing protein